MPDGALLDGFDHLVRHAEHGVVAEAHPDGVVGAVRRKTGRRLGRRNDRREVPIGDVGHPRPGHQARGENPVEVGFLRFLDAVGGHQDGAREGIEFLPLILPGPAVIARQVRVLFQAGVGQRRQHLAVGVHADSRPRSLLQQGVKVLQIVARHQDGLALERVDAHPGGLGVAVRARVGRIQEFHDPDVDLAHPQRQRQQRIGLRVRPGQCVQRLMEEGENRLVFLAQDQRVIGISRHAFQAVGDELLDTHQVLAPGTQPALDADLRPLLEHLAAAGSGDQAGRITQALGSPAGLPAGRRVRIPSPVPQSGDFPDHGLQPCRIEVDVGHGGEQRLDDRQIVLPVTYPERPEPVGVHRQSFGDVKQQVLKGGGIRILAAHAGLGATAALGRLFTLITKHTHCRLRICNVSLSGLILDALRNIDFDLSQTRA